MIMKWGYLAFDDKEPFKMLCLGMQAVGMVNDHLLDCEFRKSINLSHQGKITIYCRG